MEPSSRSFLRSFLADRPAPTGAPPRVSPRERLRVLDRITDFHACVALQEATWGRDGETVPVSMLTVATKIGGLAIGALDEQDALIGFVFGLAGVDAEGPLHWSHMLAVRPEARGAGLGRALKERQRAVLEARGVQRIAWTFDPLQARNAHLNINRLGARIVEYVDDMYGVTRSPLHLGLATDRLIAMTATPARTIAASPASAVSIGERLVLTLSEPGSAPLTDALPASVLVEIPWEIEDILATDPARAARWREATRRHFHHLVPRGYVVAGFVRDPATRRAFYSFVRTPEAP